MMLVVVNPGGGPVPDATAEHATANMAHLLTDMGEERARFVAVPDLDYGEGRYAFLVWRDNVCFEVQMPGLPLHQVRYLTDTDQNIWDFPRLYVDGSSWAWAFALSTLQNWPRVVWEEEEEA